MLRDDETRTEPRGTDDAADEPLELRRERLLRELLEHEPPRDPDFMEGL